MGRDYFLYMENQVYYRPEWTGGRYDEKHNVAIFYNLIGGYSFYFEDYSAIVIREILNTSKNGEILLSEISRNTDISIDSLIPFFIDLEQRGIVTSVFPSKEIVENYRKDMSAYRINNSQKQERSIEEKLPFDKSNAEMSYFEKVGGVTAVMFELTYNCSEKCIHCYNLGATRNDSEKSHRGDREELNLEDYKRIIDELYEEGLVKVILTGGDPFSKPIAWDIIDYLFERGVMFDIYTNGQRLVNDIQRLIDYYPRLVGVSLYSGDAKVHDFITRIKGSWERSMIVVRLLSEKAVPLNLKCCIMRPNVKTYRKILDIAKEVGAVPQFEVNITDSIDGDKCASRYLRLTPELLEIVLRDNHIPMYVGPEVPDFGNVGRNPENSACGAGENSFCITPEGYFIPCCAFHLIFGNLKKQSLKEILKSSSNLSYWQNLKLKDYEECGVHEYCNYCNLCSGVNFSEHGTPVKASENNCYMAKVRYDLAIKMKTGYDPLHNKSIDKCLEELPNYKVETISRYYNERTE